MGDVGRISNSARAGVGSVSEQPAVERQALARRAPPQSETIRAAGVGSGWAPGVPAVERQALARRAPPQSETIRAGDVGSSLRFAAAVRVVAAEARSLGLEVPGFRSPPRLEGANRSLRRRPGAPPAVAVRLAGRPFEAVITDMIEGVVVANGLTGPTADQARRHLLAAAVREANTAAA